MVTEPTTDELEARLTADIAAVVAECDRLRAQRNRLLTVLSEVWRVLDYHTAAVDLAVVRNAVVRVRGLCSDAIAEVRSNG